MRKGKRVILIAIAVLIILTSLSVKAEYVTDAKETLRGIKRILIVVKRFHQEAQAYGLSKDKIKRDVELKLQMAGIEIIPLEEFPTLEPYLFIKINIVYQLGIFAYSSLVELKQLVYLGNNPELSLDAVTWSKIITGTAQKRDLEETVRSSVKNLMDIFLNDHLTVNTKQESNSKQEIVKSFSFIVNKKGKTYIIDKRGERWDITQAVSIGFKPEKFQYGLGRNAIIPLDENFLSNDVSKIPSNLRIIGIAEHADAQAYSIPKLTRHEIANTTIGSKPIAAAY